MAPAARTCARAIEYDGTAFAGSQRQPQQRTVQGELEDALNKLTGERVTIRFAGRTDAGVHATGQVIAFCLKSPPAGSGSDGRTCGGAGTEHSRRTWWSALSGLRCRASTPGGRP